MFHLMRKEELCCGECNIYPFSSVVVITVITFVLCLNFGSGECVMWFPVFVQQRSVLRFSSQQTPSGPVVVRFVEDRDPKTGIFITRLLSLISVFFI